ncbi:MAG: alpha/beta hydrolase [Flavobacteriales bacterium]|nr:alpha/beta hydrolase [Flavobacteriales bacterium]MDW8432803.1 alpha/beta hydrolase [Flavobacteriales bacterium]
MKQPRIAYQWHQPELPNGRPPLVFIHGMAHGAWCWEWLWVPWLLHRGYTCLTLNLRGHGESEGWERLSRTPVRAYVQDVRFVLSHLDTLPVVVGHSMGGFIVQKLLLSRTPLKGAVLVAPVPASGFGRALWTLFRLEPARFLKGLITFSTTPFTEDVQVVKRLCFSQDAPEERVHSTFMALQPESFRAFLDMVIGDLHRPAPTQVPTLILASGKDCFVPLKALERTTRGFGAHLQVFEDVAHDMMLDTRWEAVCAIMESWIRNLPEG